MTLTKEQILKNVTRKTEAVNVPEWGGTVYLREMTGAERDEFEVAVYGGGKISGNVRAQLLVRCLCDESGARLFESGDVEALGNLPAGPLDRLFAEAQKLNALTRDGVDDARGN